MRHVEEALLPIGARHLHGEGVGDEAAIGPPAPGEVERIEGGERRRIGEVAPRSQAPCERRLLPVDQVLHGEGETEGAPKERGVGTEEHRERKGETRQRLRTTPLQRSAHPPHHRCGQRHTFEPRRAEFRETGAARQGERGEGDLGLGPQPADDPRRAAQRCDQGQEVPEEGRMGNARFPCPHQGEQRHPEEIRVPLHPLARIEDRAKPRGPVLRVAETDEGVVGEPTHRPGVCETERRRAGHDGASKRKARRFQPGQRRCERDAQTKKRHTICEGAREGARQLRKHPVSGDWVRGLLP